MSNMIKNYFQEFSILNKVSKDFWLTNGIQFFDGLAYFSMMTVISIYLTTNCGFSDIDSGAWVGIFTLYITAFMFAVGSICDTIGIKKSFYIGITLCAIARLGLGMVPTFPNLTYPIHLPFGFETTLNTTTFGVKAMIIVLSLGTAFMSPVTMTALRRFTSKETRATGFNLYYLLMNIGAFLANLVILDGFRGLWGEAKGNLAIFDFGFVMSICALVCVYFIDENNCEDHEERADEAAPTKRPLAIFLEVWKERPFQKLLLFLVLTIGVRLVFTHQFLVMPKYYTRVLSEDTNLGAFNSINPFIIMGGLILLIPIINRYSTIKLIVIGMAVSAFSLVSLAVPVEWVLKLPLIDNTQQAYIFMIVSQILIFAVGELIFSPRFTEYIASVSPPDKVSSYMALSALPTFISKPINGFVSGILISRFCYDGIRPKIETGNIDYAHSPEWMWAIYLGLAIMSPIAVIAMRNFITSKSSSEIVPQPTTQAPCTDAVEEVVRPSNSETAHS